MKTLRSTGSSVVSGISKAASATYKVVSPHIPRVGDEFTNIDTYALSVPRTAEATVALLAQNLTQTSRTEREKARAIFRWIANSIDYDDTAQRAGAQRQETAEEVLRSRHAVCQGYANLFAALAQAAGLEAKVVAGFGRGSGYWPGAAYGPNENHAWNAVRINGRWELLDCTWGTGYYDRYAGRTVRRFEPFYFLTDPGEFLYSHFPADSTYQFIRPSLSQAEHERLADLKPAFFRNELKLDKEKQNTLLFDQSVKIAFRTPSRAFLSATLERADGSRDEGATFCQREARDYSVYVVTSRAGEHMLRIFVGSKDQAVQEEAVVYRVTSRSGTGHPNNLPKVYLPFQTHGARLDKPFSGTLRARTIQHFSITVPDALNVAVMTGGAMVHLPREDDHFAGDVDLQAGPVTIAAQFGSKPQPGQEVSYEGLLEFQAS